MAERETGSVKFFNKEKGFGFITRDAGGDVFVHLYKIKDRKALEVADRVSFTVIQGDRGPAALDVEKVAP